MGEAEEDQEETHMIARDMKGKEQHTSISSTHSSQI